ncbi:MAG: haloacid dehalogenase [Caldilineae bacterium]|nr:MAG: haloacid dehalogenase [Caldilineae bacterium]
MANDELADIVDAVIQEMEQINQLRDATLARSRQLIRACAHSIRAMHRHEVDQARSMLADARDAAQAMTAPLADFPELYYTGYTQDALKEVVEAHLLFAFITGEPLPTPTELKVTGATYLKGLSEAATEMRRFALDLMRRDQVDAAEPFLQRMDDIYALLVTVDFPDAVTGGLRRQTDVLRGVLERTRGDLTMAMRQEKMRTALERFEARIQANES